MLLYISLNCHSSQMSDVKRLPDRLECLLFRARFQEELDELTPVSVLLHVVTCTY